MTDPAIITVAPNGARRTKADHSALPMTAAEIGIVAARCREAGAAAIHLHVRDRDGAHVLDADLYRDAIAAIRREAGTGMIVEATTEAVGRYRPAEQIALVRDLRPEAFSVAPREILGPGGGEDALTAAAAFLNAESRRGALIRYIVYDAADAERLQGLIEDGIFPDIGTAVLFVLGRYAADQRSAPTDLLPFLTAWRLPLRWGVCAFGPGEAAAALAALSLGGDVRVGFENNLWLPDGGIAAGNEALVANVAAAARLAGRELASGAHARRLWSGR